MVGVIFFARWMLQIKDYIDDFEKDLEREVTDLENENTVYKQETQDTGVSEGLSETESLVPTNGSVQSKRKKNSLRKNFINFYNAVK